MNKRKFFFLMITIISILAISCDKTATEPEENSLAGTWVLRRATTNWVITTNSNQTARIPLSGIGSVKIGGTFNTVLNSLSIYNNNPLTIGVVELIDEEYIVTILIIDDNSRIATVSTTIREGVFVGPVDYTFDGTTLTINETTLTNQNNNDEFIVVNGSISFETMSVPPNSPIRIKYSDGGSNYGQSAIEAEFLDDGTFTMDYNLTDSTFTEMGTWVTDGDTLRTTTIENNVTTINDFIFSFEANVLSLTSLYDGCAYSQNVSGCLQYVEGILGLESSSLTKVEVEQKLYFRETTSFN